MIGEVVAVFVGWPVSSKVGLAAGVGGWWWWHRAARPVVEELVADLPEVDPVSAPVEHWCRGCDGLVGAGLMVWSPDGEWLCGACVGAGVAG